MSERTGLGVVETSLLHAVGQAQGPRRTEAVLDRLDRDEQLGPSYAVLALRDLGAAWTTTLPLFAHHGNWGSLHGDAMADAHYTEVGLTTAGRVALRAERGEVGPVPVSLIVGSAYRGGRVPPLDARDTIGVLRELMSGARVPTARLGRLVRQPSGGLVAEGMDDLVAGRAASVVLTSLIETGADDRGRAYLAIRGVPLGVAIDELAECVTSRLDARVRPPEDYADHEPRMTDDYYEKVPISPVLACYLRDDTCDRNGTDVRIVLQDPADRALLPELEAWVRGVWPVTIEVRWRVPGGLPALLRRWADACAVDPSGLDALEAALA